MNLEEQTRLSIVKAARACFLRYGAQKTNMTDVAKAADLSRSGVYRYFALRDDLIEAAILSRLSELADGISQVLKRQKSVADAFYAGALATVDSGRNDKELQNLLSMTNSVRVNRLISGESPEAQRVMLKVWQPTFDRARQKSLMRDDISDSEVIEWMRGTFLPMLLREHLTRKHKEDLIRKFLLPTLLKPAALQT